MPIDPTRKGKYRIVRPDGTELEDQHNYMEEVYGKISTLPNGTYKVLPPWTEVVKTSDPPEEQPPADDPPEDEPPADAPPVEEPPVEEPPAGTNPFNALYPAGFRLPAMAADPIPSVTRPPKATGLADAVIDATYKTRIYRMADAEAEGSRDQLRQDYSRRQAFNADNTRFILIDGSGSVHLYDAATFKRLKTLPMAGGDSEPLWHPANPRLIRHTDYTGGRRWYELDVESGAQKVLFDFAEVVPWPDAVRFWTKAEGSFDRSGRYICLMAQTSSYAMRGFVCVDMIEGRIIGSMSASQAPDHVSMSASGKFCIVSGSQTIAYSRDFATKRVLYDRSEHSDCGLDANGRDVIVHAVFASGADEGWIVSTDMETGAHTRITRVYDDNHGSTTVHISCQGKPGWCVVSAYDDFSNYSRYPANPLQPLHRKVSLHSTDGQKHYSVAHIHGDKSVGNSYYHEPQATVSRDGSRIVFASSYSAPGPSPAGQPEAYMVGLPDSVYA